MPIDSLIFDLDGTLWDSTAQCATGWNAAVQKLGVQSKKFAPADIASIMGMPHKKIYEKMFPTLSDAERSQIARECYEEEIRIIQTAGASLYPGVAEGLRALHPKYPLYVLSNCLVEYLDTFLEATGFSKLFVQTLCHGHTGKTKGENMKNIVKSQKLKHPVYIGDTASDQSASTEAGVRYIHMEYGFGKPKDPCERFASFPDLVQFLLADKVE